VQEAHTPSNHKHWCRHDYKEKWRVQYFSHKL
jgi:hypothetical protein